MTELTKSIMTASEVLTWIAFRRPITQEQLGILFRVSIERWACVPADAVLEALEARAGVSGDGPHCAIRWANGPLPFRQFGAHRILHRGTLDAAMDTQTASKSDRNVGVVRYPRTPIREEITADEKTSEQLEDAKILLRDRAAGGLLVVYGISLDPDGKLSAGASVRAIPATVFMHPAMAITEWDEAHADTTKPVKLWHNQKLPRFGDIQFRTVDVLALWPPAQVSFVAETTTEVAEFAMTSGLDDTRLYPNTGACEADKKRAEALLAMREYAEGVVATSGFPPKRDVAAQACNKATDYPVREGRELYAHLPDHLRNLPRKRK